MKKTIIVAMTVLACGCFSKGYRELNGTQLVAGINTPSSSTLELTAVEYLNGHKIEVIAGNKVRHKSTHMCTNNFFGVIRTVDVHSEETEVEPVALQKE